jgi:hypothetical protein
MQERPEMRHLRSHSFGGAALQSVVGLTVVLLTVGAVYPIYQEIDAANQRARAWRDLRQLAGDMLRYKRDTGRWPRRREFAYTDGEPALAESSAFGTGASADHITAFLIQNEPPVRGWNGPYMSLSRPDPWGRRYIAFLDGLEDRSPPYGWVISAGPNGIFETTKNDRVIYGDDMGFLVR